MKVVIELFCILLLCRVAESRVYFMVKAHLRLDCFRCHVWLAATLLTNTALDCWLDCQALRGPSVSLIIVSPVPNNCPEFSKHFYYLNSLLQSFWAVFSFFLSFFLFFFFCYSCLYSRASLVDKMVKSLPAMQETPGSIPGWGRSPGALSCFSLTCPSPASKCVLLKRATVFYSALYAWHSRCSIYGYQKEIGEERTLIFYFKEHFSW